MNTRHSNISHSIDSHPGNSRASASRASTPREGAAHESRPHSPCTALSLPVSRRAFLSLTAVAGSLTFLGQFTLGRKVIMAYADENGNLHFSVYVLSYEEVPVLAFDLTDPARPAALEGFSVEATTGVMMPKQGSSEKVLTQVTSVSERLTDIDGFTTIKIRKLTDEYERELTSYSCWAKLTATKAGYRVFETGQTLLTSGVPCTADGVYPNTVIVISSPDTGAPYLSMLAFDGLDVQYSQQNAYIAPMNDFTHNISVAIRNAQNKTWDIILYDGNTKLDQASTTSADGKIATATIKNTWLDGNHGVKVGSRLYVAWVPKGEKDGSRTRLLCEFDRAVMLFKEGYAKGYTLSHGRALDTTANFEKGAHSTKYPGDNASGKNWLEKTGTLTVGGAPLPVEIICYPDGTIVVTATIAGMFFMKRRDGEDMLKKPDQMWKPITPKDIWKVCSKEFTRFAGRCADLYNAETGNWGTFGSSLAHTKPLSNLDISIDVLLQGMGRTVPTSAKDPENNTLTNIDFSVGSMGKLAFAWHIPFTIGPIPCFAGVDFTASIKVMLVFAMTSERINGVKQSAKWASTSIKGLPASIYTLHLEGGFTFGVGARNIISISGRAYGYCTFTFSTKKTADSTAELTGLMGAGIEVMAQFLMFCFTATPTKLDPPWKFLDKKFNGVALPESTLRPDRFGAGDKARTPIDLSDQDYPVFEFRKSDMLSEDALKTTCRLVTYTRCVRDEQSNTQYWDEGCDVEGEWTSGALESSYAEPKTDDFGSILDPYNSGERNYNPLRGIMPVSSTLLRLFAFSDDRSSIESVFHTWNSEDKESTWYGESGDVDDEGNTCGWHSTWYRIDTVEVRARSEAAMEDFSVYADSSDSEAPTCYHMLSSSEGDGEVADGRKYVMRSRLLWSVQVGDLRFWFDNVVRADCIPDRINTFDADFDTTHLNTTMYLALCSFRRPKGEDKSFDNIFSTQFITLIMRDINGATEGSAFLHSDEFTRWAPRIAINQPRPNVQLNPGYICSVYFYQRPKGGGTVTLGRGDYIQSESRAISTKISQVDVPARIAGMLEQGTFYVNYADCNTDSGRWDERKADDLQQRFLAWVKPKRSADDTALAVFWHEGHADTAVIVENVSSIAKRPNVMEKYEMRYLFSRDQTEAGEKEIFMVTFHMGNRTITGPTKVAHGTITSFITYGDYLYTVRSMDGMMPAFESSEDSDSVHLAGTQGPFTSPQAVADYGTGPGGEVSQYQILRATWLEAYGCYTHFYPIAQSEEPIDNVVITNAAYGHNGRECVLHRSVVSSQDCTAHVYDLYIPHVVGIQTEGVDAYTKFCLQGDPCWIDIKVSNTGNEPLKSFKFRVTARGLKTESGGKFETVGFASGLADKKLASPDDRIQEVDASGVPTGNWITKERKYIVPGTLLPGQTRSYRVSFTMPKGIQGQTTFDVSAFVDVNDAGYGNENAAENAESAENAAESSEVFVPATYSLTDEDLVDLVLLNDPRTQSVEFAVESLEAGIDLSEYSAGETLAWNRDTGSSDDGTKAVAATGDSGALGVIGAAGAAAVGAAAAGVAWYEKRRAENEG